LGEVAQGLVLGIVGYDYRQLEHDSGPTAFASTVKGQVDAGLSYTSLGTWLAMFEQFVYPPQSPKRTCSVDAVLTAAPVTQLRGCAAAEFACPLRISARGR
jgi:hypothetical protein